MQNSEWKKIVAELKSTGIKVFYHFTCRSNAESIKKHGLLSRRRLRDAGIPFSTLAREADLEWQKKSDEEFEDYVQLKLTREDQRIRQDKDTIIVLVNLDVLRYPGIVFSNKDLWCKDKKVSSGLNGFHLIKLEYFRYPIDYDRCRIDNEYRLNLGAEILVNGQISTNDIIAIEPFLKTY
ncbi:MAG: DarT ssDNA thymidine ADP-ribosyltransferase family protein [Patescibacteria group bacterium]